MCEIVYVSHSASLIPHYVDTYTTLHLLDGVYCFFYANYNNYLSLKERTLEVP